MNVEIDTYIHSFPPQVVASLQSIRQLIKELAPQAEEAIKYGMPTFVWKGNLVHYAAYSKHIGFYPSPSGIEQFRNELEKYKYSKGAIQFPLDEPLPLDLIRRIVAFRLEENERKRK